MKTVSKLAIAALLGLGVAATTATADADLGKTIYSKKYKKACGMTGAKFAAKHSQDEWETLMDDGEFANEMAKICPGVPSGDAVPAKFLEHLYDFSYKFANDSGNVPSC